jgi:hypothetical protein
MADRLLVIVDGLRGRPAFAAIDRPGKAGIAGKRLRQGLRPADPDFSLGAENQLRPVFTIGSDDFRLDAYFSLRRELPPKITETDSSITPGLTSARHKRPSGAKAAPTASGLRAIDFSHIAFMSCPPAECAGITPVNNSKSAMASWVFISF